MIIMTFVKMSVYVIWLSIKLCSHFGILHMHMKQTVSIKEHKEQKHKLIFS